MDKVLKKAAFRGVEGPVLTIVMDGVGLAPANEANAVAAANTPTLDMLMAKYPMVKLKAHGTQLGGRTQRARRGAGLCAGRKAGLPVDRKRQDVRRRDLEVAD